MVQYSKIGNKPIYLIMEKRGNNNNDEFRQYDERIKARLGINDEDAKKRNFISRYFLRHFLLIIGWFIIAMVIGCVANILAIYKTDFSRKMWFGDGFSVPSNDFFYSTLGFGLVAFFMGMFFWYLAVKRFSRKK